MPGQVRWAIYNQSDSAVDSIGTVRMPIGGGGAHWRHLANTSESSVCGGDAALCEITLTTCFMQINFCILLLAYCDYSIISLIETKKLRQ